VENGLKIPEVVHQIVNHQDIEHVSNLLSNVIDFDESRNENRVIIRPGVSDILDKARSRYESIDNILEEVACQIQQENPLLSTITLHYIPQVGYVIKSASRSAPPSFKFQFQEDCKFYFKVPE
jgi:DNA mismatch repair protein MSH5